MTEMDGAIIYTQRLTKIIMDDHEDAYIPLTMSVVCARSIALPPIRHKYIPAYD